MIPATSARSPTRRSETVLGQPPLFNQPHQKQNITTFYPSYPANVSRESPPPSLFSPCALTPSPHSSACTCPGEDHPGPANNIGRGAPEIDMIEAERNKQGQGQVASQSAQFAPFTHDYLYGNATADQWTVFDPTITMPNTYKWVFLFRVLWMRDGY
jgi:hypothetical protein